MLLTFGTRIGVKSIIEEYRIKTEDGPGATVWSRLRHPQRGGGYIATLRGRRPESLEETSVPDLYRADGDEVEAIIAEALAAETAAAATVRVAP